MAKQHSTRLPILFGHRNGEGSTATKEDFFNWARAAKPWPVNYGVWIPYEWRDEVLELWRPHIEWLERVVRNSRDDSSEWMTLPATQEYAKHLTFEEQVALYECLRACVSDEQALREAFESVFPSSKTRLPAIRTQEELEAEAEAWQIEYDEIHAPKSFDDWSE